MQRAFFAAGRQIFLFCEKERKSADINIHIPNLLIHAIWITLESNIYFLVFLKFHVKTLKNGRNKKLVLIGWQIYSNNAEQNSRFSAFGNMLNLPMN